MTSNSSHSSRHLLWRHPQETLSRAVLALIFIAAALASFFLLSLVQSKPAS